MNECPKCHYAGGNDWHQCRGRCAMPGSPCYDATWAQDFEILQWAAKALGCEARTQYAGAVQLFRDGKYLQFWNPLNDDGDAHRLAVALQLTVRNEHLGAGTVYCTQGDTVFDGVWSGTSADVAVEPQDYIATRRAIVLAAAQIGKQIKV